MAYIPAGFREIRHDLLDHAAAGTVYVSGEAAAADNFVFFCAGYPCDHSSFVPLAQRLVDAEPRCFVGVGCLPEYDRVGVRGEAPLKPEGYDLEEMSRCFEQAVTAFLAEAGSGRSPKLTVVVHDWAVPPGMYFSNGRGCDKLVVFDVLMPADGCQPDRIYYMLNHLTYQGFFAFSFLISRVSNRLGQVLLHLGTRVILAVCGRWLNPVGPRDMVEGEGPGMHQQMFAPLSNPGLVRPFLCYPYFKVFKMVLGGGEKLAAMQASMDFDASLRRQPICFIYGKAKNTHFHSQGHLRKLRETPGCVEVGIANTGHWCYKQEPELCFQHVRRFIMGRSASEAETSRTGEGM
mmetsp:Transcript_49724/g.151365  ORF Transcript_49724/g.151365 Transcript_49724/m.151365 type:complete len:348 (-) Transcript_49724:15-1058(-)